MEVALTLESTLNQQQSSMVVHLSDDLGNYFNNKYFGNDVKEHIINIICVTHEFDFFFKIRKPKYYKSQQKLEKGVLLQLNKIFIVDVKLNYGNGLSDEDLLIELIEKIKESLDLLDQLPKYVTDFDKSKYKSEVLNFLQEYRIKKE